jgi:triosephosphate isomerase
LGLAVRTSIGARKAHSPVKFPPTCWSPLGATWVLIGHSERRWIVASETDADVLKKTQAALLAGLKPIVCVGEKLEEYKAGKTNEVLIKQFAAGIAGLTEEQFAQIVIAYEPLWAIGTGQTATPKSPAGPTA